MRRHRALVAAAALAVSLVACTSAPEEGDDPQPTASSDPTTSLWCDTTTGPASESISASGEFGSPPALDFETGISAATTERTVLIEGSGDELGLGQTAYLEYALYSGRTGELIEATGQGELERLRLTVTEDLLPGFGKSLLCLNEGTRVVSVVPPADAFGEAGLQQGNFDIAGDESLVFVFDLIDVVPLKAWGQPQPPVDGMPLVTLFDDGAPTVTLTGGTAPGSTQIAVLKKGDGEPVNLAAGVELQYYGMSWETGEVFDQSWGKSPYVAQFAGTFIQGFNQAIDGQPEGSQILVVIPPDQAYGTDPAAHALGGQTLVFVIDILDVFGTE